MPSKNKDDFVVEALDCILHQTYGNIEVIIVRSFEPGDDTTSKMVSRDGVLFRHVQVLYCDKSTSIGERRNLAIRYSVGSIIAHFDDDDWSHPTRIARQVEQLKDNRLAVCGTSKIKYVDDDNRLAWIYDGSRDNFIPGGTFCYWRSTWEMKNFDPFLPYGEDTRWQKDLPIIDLADHSLYTARIHDNNTCKKQPSPPQWTQIEYSDVWRNRGTNRVPVALA